MRTTRGAHAAHATTRASRRRLPTNLARAPSSRRTRPPRHAARHATRARSDEAELVARLLDELVELREALAHAEALLPAGDAGGLAERRLRPRALREQIHRQRALRQDGHVALVHGLRRRGRRRDLRRGGRGGAVAGGRGGCRGAVGGRRSRGGEEGRGGEASAASRDAHRGEDPVRHHGGEPGGGVGRGWFLLVAGTWRRASRNSGHASLLSLYVYPVVGVCLPPVCVGLGA